MADQPDDVCVYNRLKEEKEKLMAEILELQNTLHDLSQRVHAVKEENEQLAADNQVLDQYIQGLLENSDIFQATLK
jgi:peptidoglycan hydrolase CwlO-like protein